MNEAQDDEDDTIGAVDSTYDSVLDYLKRGCGLETEEAVALLTKHKAILDSGIASRSFAYYTGDRILEAEDE